MITAINAVVTGYRSPVGGGGGGSLAEFSDDFVRPDNASLGANWTEAAGDLDIFSDTLRCVTGGFAENVAIYSAEGLTTTSGYIRVTRRDDGSFPSLIFRYTNSSSAFYYLSFSNTNVSWNSRSAIGGSDTQIGSSVSITSGVGTVFAITWTGTGSGTEIRIWANPTGGSNTPTSSSDWGGDVTPDVTFTDDPGANAVDSGAYVGLGGYQGSANTCRFEGFFGGDTP